MHVYVIFKMLIKRGRERMTPYVLDCNVAACELKATQHNLYTTAKLLR